MYVILYMLQIIGALFVLLIGIAYAVFKIKKGRQYDDKHIKSRRNTGDK